MFNYKRLIPWFKLGLDRELEILINTIIYILSLGMMFGLFSFIFTIYDERLYLDGLCISNRCLGFFFSKIDNIIKIFQATAWLLTLITTIGGITIAVMTYKSGVKNSNLTNHISHLNMFRDYVNAEIGKRKFVSSDKINIYKWYSLIFPKSKRGDVSVSKDYKNKINAIKDVVVKANDDISTPDLKYSYQNHQRDLINIVDVLGIKISTGPKNEFILVEEQVFELIDCINITFTELDIELSSIKRLYT
ncbi:retron Ec48 family effector membrane protein [Yersinia enterocolitica]|uniref:retron Ec48 family effector membrane protein n=1 Tax=Yersinia enterocolitica TaxID=630 RepID=UPI0034DA7EE5|nr:retron Ec48 family effector membrane protein [Yersinia enterocolitica]